MIAVITDVHYRMSLALIRDLKELGAKIYACEYEDIASPVGFSSMCVSKCVFLPRDGYAEELYRLCASIYECSGEKPALFPVGAGTLSLLSPLRQRFSAVCGLLCPTPEQLSLFNDKRCVALLAEEAGLPIPRLWKTAGEAELPAVVKPACGEKFGLHAEKRYRIAQTQTELTAACDHFEMLTNEPPLIQQYLSGGGAGCSVLAKDGNVLAYICHERIREYPVTGGPSSCCRCVNSPELLRVAETLVRRTGFSGVAMFEFKADSHGKYYLLEVNPRVWGTYPLTRVSGSNFAQLWMEASMGVPVSEFIPGRETSMVYYPSDMAAVLGYLRRGKVKTAFTGILDFFRPAVKNGMRDLRDRKPYWVYLQSLFTRRSHD